MRLTPKLFLISAIIMIFCSTAAGILVYTQTFRALTETMGPSGALFATSEAQRIAVLAVLWTIVIVMLLMVAVLAFLIRPLEQLMPRATKLLPSKITPPANEIITVDLAFQEVTHTVKQLLATIHKKNKTGGKDTEFISLTSHQLLTPLAALRWHAELLLDHPTELTKEHHALVAQMYDSTKSMISLVNTLLNVSRCELGTVPVQLKTTTVKEVIDAVLADVQAQLTEKKQTLTCTYAPRLPKLTTDPQLLNVIVQNLFTNASKYSPEGNAITATVAVAGKRCVITVTDSGMGIPKKDQARIFEKGFRATNALQKNDGNGLGLYLTKKIVTQLGGDIRFTSKEKEGTTFTVALPIHQ